ncbi:MAG: hypothetical protein F6K47_14570 [Symploca sp. SIO2E6]|nr:hypothetical protein [Symploca sp. SIO2E6]
MWNRLLACIYLQPKIWITGKMPVPQWIAHITIDNKNVEQASSLSYLQAIILITPVASYNRLILLDPPKSPLAGAVGNRISSPTSHIRTNA